MRSRGANEEKVEMPQVAIQGSSGFFAGLRLRSTDELGDRREVVPWKDPIVEGQPGDYLVRRERRVRFDMPSRSMSGTMKRSWSCGSGGTRGRWLGQIVRQEIEEGEYGK